MRMMRALPYMVALVVTMFLPLIMADAFLGGPSTTFVSLHRTTSPSSALLMIRGGATTAADSQEDIEIESSEDEAESEDEEEEEEEEEKEEGLDAKLVKSAQTKAATIKTKIAKAAVQAAIASTIQPKVKKSSSSKSLLKLLHVPYIIRACLNPFTFLKMTRAYFGSLVQLDYLNDNDSSKDLRSALQEKAKKSDGGGGGTSPRGKRKFKPGKAKTLSDLPVLNT